MEWTGEGALLSARKHGETSVIIEVFTREHGRHAGVVRGGVSRKFAAFLQPGNQVSLTWRARLQEHLGSFAVEPIRSRAAQVMGERKTLAALGAVAALLRFALPEREAHPVLYGQTVALLDMLGEDPDWPLAYLQWERALLEELGFGLDLSQCAVSGVTEGLAYVSPKTGRAVSVAGAGEWAERLLPLPPELFGVRRPGLPGLAAGLTTTGHFLRHGLAHSLGNKPLPEARARLIDLLTRA
ncbi:MAG: DNA repair protein RecO [Rhodobacterales bacterium]|nr:MAG: DNA repair protein RecO [Rhodobacterales bacterium]